MMTPERICVRDRRMAAVHEAGHIVTARALGFEVLSAWIGKNEGEVVERTWIGDVRIAGLEKADDVSRRMVGVAGSVAAHCGAAVSLRTIAQKMKDRCREATGRWPDVHRTFLTTCSGMLSEKSAGYSRGTVLDGKNLSPNPGG
jgi:hypothetical protein